MQLKTALAISFATLFSLSRFSFSMENKMVFKPIIKQNDFNPINMIFEFSNGDPLPIGQKKIIVKYKDNKPNLCLSHDNFAICCTASDYTFSKTITGSKDTNIIIWNTKNGKKEKVLQGHTAPILQLVYTKDNNAILSCSYDGTIKKWNPHTGLCIGTFTGHKGAVFCANPNENESLLASGSEDKTIKIWNLNTYECINTLIGHQKRVLDVQLKGTTIVSGSYDKTIKIWSIFEKNCLYTLSGHTAPIYQISLGDENQIIACDYHSKTTTWLPDSLIQKIVLYKMYFALLCCISQNDKNKKNNTIKNTAYWLLGQIIQHQPKPNLTLLPIIESPIREITCFPEKFNS